MKITQKMLEAGVKKALDLRVLPRKQANSNQGIAHQIMHEILQAALSATPELGNGPLCSAPSEENRALQ